MNSGYILTGPPVVYEGMQYSGMDTTPFPLETKHWPSSLSAEEKQQWESCLFFSENDISFLNLDIARSYFSACIQNGLSVRILYADIRSDTASAKDLPRSPKANARFLGYDVGECSCDFSSAIISDILLRPKLLPGDFRAALNENGLFSTEKDARTFLRMRTEMKQHAEPMTFEEGVCRVLALYELSAEAFDT